MEVQLPLMNVCSLFGTGNLLIYPTITPYDDTVPSHINRYNQQSIIAQRTNHNYRVFTQLLHILLSDVHDTLREDAMKLDHQGNTLIMKVVNCYSSSYEKDSADVYQLISELIKRRMFSITILNKDNATLLDLVCSKRNLFNYILSNHVYFITHLVTHSDLKPHGFDSPYRSTIQEALLRASDFSTTQNKKYIKQRAEQLLNYLINHTDLATFDESNEETSSFYGHLILHEFPKLAYDLMCKLPFDPDAVIFGSTAFMSACYRGYTNIVSLMLQEKPRDLHSDFWFYQMLAGDRTDEDAFTATLCSPHFEPLIAYNLMLSGYPMSTRFAHFRRNEKAVDFIDMIDTFCAKACF
jgi:hypothetical protein